MVRIENLHMIKKRVWYILERQNLRMVQIRVLHIVGKEVWFKKTSGYD